MKYQTGDKISIKNVDFTIEILARYPGAQAAVISQFLGNSNYYRVLLDGMSTYISEPVLNLLIENMKNKSELLKSLNTNSKAIGQSEIDKKESIKRPDFHTKKIKK